MSVTGRSGSPASRNHGAARCGLVATAIGSVLLAAATASGERLPVRTLTTSDGLPRDQLACVRSDARGFLWFCTGDGVVRFDGYRVTTFGREEGLVPSEVRSFLITSDGRYWAGASAGLYELQVNRSDGRPRFRAIPRDDEQPTRAILALWESPDGSIWCASGRGLLRLERGGGRDHLREIDIGLPRDVQDLRIVRTVLEDPAGTLWVGSASGLFERRPDGQVLRLTVEDGLPVNEIRALALDTAGRLWAATRAGLAWIERESGEHHDRPRVRRVFTSSDGLPKDNVNSLLVDTHGLWIGTVNGIVEAQVTAAGTLRLGRRLTGFGAWGIARDRNRDVWIATDSGARRLARNGFTTYLREDGLTSTRVSSVFTTGAGELCATTLVGVIGVSCFDGTRFRAIPIGALRSQHDPGWGWSQLTLQDHAGRWWIPTGEGLLRFPAGPAGSLRTSLPRIYDVASGLRSNDIFRIFEDSSGGVWASTFAENGNGLVRIDVETGRLHTFGEADGLPADLPQAHSFAQDRSGNVWIGCESGVLLRYREGRFEPIPIHSSEESPTGAFNEHLRSLLVDRRGRLWIASALAGVGRIDDPAATSPRVRWYDARQGLSSNTAWMLLEHNQGNIFVGTPRGVDRLDPETGGIGHFTPEDGVPRGEIWGAVRDRSGDLWFATSNGLARLRLGDDSELPPPVTVVTSVRAGGVPLPVAPDGATLVRSIVVEPGDRTIEVEFVSPGDHPTDALRYEHRLDGVSRDWMATRGRVVTLVGLASGSYGLLIRAVRASGIAGDPARVDFTVMAPLWRRGWFLALVTSGGVMLALAYHRARLGRHVELERVRSRIAADLHDGVGASLSRIAVLSEVVRRQAGPVLPDAVPMLASIADNAREVVDDMSDAVWSIDPRLDNLQEVVVRGRALASALFDDASIAWRLDGPEQAPQIPLAAEQRRHLYLILKEALTNVVRHSRAQRVTVTIAVENRHLRVQVTDDGVGIDDVQPARQRGGRGLGNLRARAEALGGVLSITTGSDGLGTVLTLDAPLGLTA